MSSKKSEREYKLLITYNIVSKPKKFYHLFTPTDVIVDELCEIRFKIKNIGNETFSGGFITHLKIEHIGTGENTKYYDTRVEIPKLPKNTSFITPVLKYIPINSGNAWFYLKIHPIHKEEKIEYYQLERARNKKALLQDVDDWRDPFYVASQQEIHQRYTNYLLLLLTALATILFVINIGLLLR